MTQRIKVAGPGFDFATLSAAIASLVGPPFVEPIILLVYSTAPVEAITIPATVQPTPANPLIIMAFGTPFVASLFADQQLDSGSHTTYPAPQPRMVAPKMGFLDIQANNVFIDCLQVNGDVVLTGNVGITANGILAVGGQIRVVRGGPTVTSILISNCESRKCPSQSAIRIENVSGVKVYHNTSLIRSVDQGVPGNPCYALEAVNSSIDSKNNILAGSGPGSFAVRYSGDPTLSTFRDNIYNAFDGGKPFRFDSGGPVTDADLMSVWISFMTSEAGSILADPEFRERTDSANIDLNISATCPEMAAAPFLPEVTHDIHGERRPIDFVTMGAHENAEVITDSGKIRFLELLSGLSTQPVNKAMLGRSGVGSLFNDFHAKLHDDPTFNPIFDTPVDIGGAVTPAAPGHEGLVIFKPEFQQTLPIYSERIDSTFDRADEVALVSADKVVFMVKRMHSIPFDAVGFMSTQFQIPVEIVA